MKQHTSCIRFGAASTTARETHGAIAPLCDAADGQLQGETAALVLIFFTSHFEDEADEVVRQLVRRYPSAMLLGCSAEGVIGPEHEHERIPAMSLMLATMPDVRMTPISVRGDELAGISSPDEWVERLGVDPSDDPTFLLLGDPFTTPIKPVLDHFNAGYPRRSVFGGMASGCEQPGQSVLVVDDQMHHDGVVGLAFTGPVDIRPAVSQGCRPIGRHLVITGCDRNVIQTLGGKPALYRLKEVLETLPPTDARLVQQERTVFVGRVINEYQESFERGDFLIRNLLGIDPSSGAIAVGEQMRVGATIQFHVRDHDSADDDLRDRLAPYKGDEAPAGALLFSCNGRGTRMWSQPDHDVTVVRDVCGPVPTCGFFAAGEIGPVGGRNFIHGHTASVALFRPCR